MSKNLLLLTILLSPFYLIRISFFGVPTNIFEILAIFSAIFFIFEKKSVFVNKYKQIPKIVLIGVLLIIFGVTTSIFANNSWIAGFGILKSWFIIPIIFSFALYLSIDSVCELEKIYLAIFLSSGAVGVISFGYKFLNMVTYDNRLTAFYLSPNHLAMFFAPGIFFGLYFVLKNIQTKSICLFPNCFLLAVLLTALFYTYSYGAFIAILFSLALTSLIKYKTYRVRLLLFFAAVLFVFILSQMNSEKFVTLINHGDRSSFSSRLTIWNVSERLIEENPIFGIGPGNFQREYLAKQSFYPPFLEWAVPQPHNIFLAFWLQTSLFGLIGFILILFFIFKKLLLFLKTNKGATFAAPLFSFFLYTVLHGLVDTTYWKNDLSFLFWICTAMIIFLSNLQYEKS